MADSEKSPPPSADSSDPEKTASSRPQIQRATSSKLTSALSRLSTNHIIDHGPAPDGGSKAWTQVLMVWVVSFATWGYINSYGVFQTYYDQTLGESQSAISWVGSIELFICFLVSTFSGRALDAGLFIPTMIFGSFCHLLGVFMTSLCSNLWSLILTQGILTGAGSGIIFCPAVGLISTYFVKRRGLAIAITSTGNSVGGVVYPIIVRQLLPKIGFSWTVRVLGFVNLFLLTTAILTLRPRLPPRKSGPLIEYKAFTEIPYLCVVGGMSLVFGGMFFVFYFVASYGRTVLGMSYTDSATILTIFNGAAIPARLLTGYMADSFAGPLNTMIPLLFINALFAFCWTAITSPTHMYIFTAFYGCSYGAFQCLFPTTLTSLNKDLSRNGVRMGMAFSVFSFAGLAGPPVGGALLATNGGGKGGYLVAQLCLGVFTAVGAGFMVVARVYKDGWSWRVKC